MTTTQTLIPTTRNVTRLFRQASLSEVQAGREWYATAHRIAGELAATHGVTLDVAAGVLSATSPLNSWGANVRLAGKVLAAGGSKTDGYLGLGLRKANAIIAGAPILPTLNGIKTQNFYRSILSAGADGVTIDRHAWSVAVNFRYEGGVIPNMSATRYESAAECYRRAARILSREYGMELSPAVVQAVTWVQWRNRYWAEGAWD